MATQPNRTVKYSNPAVVGSAVTPNGNQSVVTTKVTNSIAGDKELEMSFTNTDDVNDVTGIKIFPGIWRKDSERALDEKITFACDGFGDDYEAVCDYFRGISTNVYGIRMETSDVSNYQAALQFKEKDPTGHEKDVKKLLSKYRVPVGNGYSETIEIDEDDLNIVQWPALELVLSKLKAGSSITIYFKVRGWNKAQDLSPLTADII